MLLPTRGKYLCKPLSRDRKLASGLWLADKIKSEKTDTVCRCIGVGEPTIKECYLCHDLPMCKKRKCKSKGKTLPIIAKRTDILHFKRAFGVRIRYENEPYILLKNQDIVAIEDDSGRISAPGSLVIVRLQYATHAGMIEIPDSAKMYNGDYWGEVISVGPEYPDRSLGVGDKIAYMRNEGYRFKGFKDRQEYFSIKEKWIGGKLC